MVSKAMSTSISTFEDNKFVNGTDAVDGLEHRGRVSDWPGTDGREFVHGLTHEFDSDGNTFGDAQKEFVDTWASAYVNDRYAFSVGQVYCNPDDPKPGALNPDPTAPQQLPQRILHHQTSFLDGDRSGIAEP